MLASLEGILKSHGGLHFQPEGAMAVDPPESLPAHVSGSEDEDGFDDDEEDEDPTLVQRTPSFLTRAGSGSDVRAECIVLLRRVLCNSAT